MSPRERKVVATMRYFNIDTVKLASKLSNETSSNIRSELRSRESYQTFHASLSRLLTLLSILHPLSKDDSLS